ncbi:phosphatidylethanolamine-binding protein, partial [Diaporthe sp. PMI_573]
LLKRFIALWAASTLVVGKTPGGFIPTSNTDLIVIYGQTAAMNGVVVDEEATGSAPTIATKSRLDGTSYAVIMVDLDIPSDQNPHTFLHWMQTDLAPATTAATISASNGSTQAFTLTNTKNTSALVAYTQPAPPAQNPLSHRYTQILVDTSSMSPAGLSVLQSAAKTRVGFDTESVLQAAGLSSNVVAGNSFNVTNPG